MVHEFRVASTGRNMKGKRDDNAQNQVGRGECNSIAVVPKAIHVNSSLFEYPVFSGGNERGAWDERLVSGQQWHGSGRLHVVALGSGSVFFQVTPGLRGAPSMQRVVVEASVAHPGGVHGSVRIEGRWRHHEIVMERRIARVAVVLGRLLVERVVPAVIA